MEYESSFICEILNYGIFQQFSNPQYQSLIDKENKLYERETVCSIEFEVRRLCDVTMKLKFVKSLMVLTVP